MFIADLIPPHYQCFHNSCTGHSENQLQNPLFVVIPLFVVVLGCLLYIPLI